MCHAMINLDAHRREVEERLRHMPKITAQDSADATAEKAGWRAALHALWAALTAGRRAA
jgi:hypothetical protein